MSSVCRIDVDARRRCRIGDECLARGVPGWVETRTDYGNHQDPEVGQVGDGIHHQKHQYGKHRHHIGENGDRSPSKSIDKATHYGRNNNAGKARKRSQQAGLCGRTSEFEHNPWNGDHHHAVGDTRKRIGHLQQTKSALIHHISQRN